MRLHVYGEIDDEIVFEILTERLDDFTTISNAFIEFLKTQEKSE